MKNKKQQHIINVYFLNALINDDFTSLDDKEKQLIHAFLDEYGTHLSADDDEFFATCEICNEKTMCVEVVSVQRVKQVRGGV